MSREYTFEDQLSMLRALLYREDFFEHPYIPSTFTDIRPLVIFMETYLKKDGTSAEARRDQRLDILSFILDFRVNTTYDLSAYQARTIYSFLVDSELRQRLGITGEQFLRDCAEYAKASVIRSKRKASTSSLRGDRAYSGVSNM